jgi:hypothetical protein
MPGLILSHTAFASTTNPHNIWENPSLNIQAAPYEGAAMTKKAAF